MNSWRCVLLLGAIVSCSGQAKNKLDDEVAAMFRSAETQPAASARCSSLNGNLEGGCFDCYDCGDSIIAKYRTEQRNISNLRFTNESTCEKMEQVCCVAQDPAILVRNNFDPPCGRVRPPQQLRTHAGALVAGEYPWLAHIYRKSSGQSYVCGAGLVGPRTLVTTAGCVRGVAADDLVVSFGDPTGNKKKVVPVLKVIRHPAYEAEHMNDIALLEVNNAKLPGRKMPACLPSKAAAFGSSCYAVSKLYTLVNSVLLKKDKCTIEKYRPQYVCALGPPLSLDVQPGSPMVCHGENSGEPYEGMTLVGLATRYQEEDIVVYVDVFSHIEWIRPYIHTNKNQ